MIIRFRIKDDDILLDYVLIFESIPNKIDHCIIYKLKCEVISINENDDDLIQHCKMKYLIGEKQKCLMKETANIYGYILVLSIVSLYHLFSVSSILFSYRSGVLFILYFLLFTISVVF